jgi:nitric oxide reductase subunit C
LQRINTTPMLHNTHKILLFGTLCTFFICYSAYIYNDVANDGGSVNALADEGKKVWQEKNCVACHQIYQLGGYLGPDLTNTYSEKGPEYIKVFVQNGTPVMPAFSLSELQMQGLLAYLKQIDSSGSADPRSFTISNDGMTQQNHEYDNQ